MPERRIIIFCKAPEPGEVKTRLAASIGARAAAGVYRGLVEQTLTMVGEAQSDAEICVCFAPPEAERRMRSWLGAGWTYQAQREGDLGQRMLTAFARAHDQGIDHTVIIGTDCPALEGKHLCKAFDLLHDHDVVLGPCTDGGYTLIAVHRPHPELFVDIPWSTETVMEETLARIEQAGLRAALLEPLRDVDTVDDLNHYGLAFSDER